VTIHVLKRQVGVGPGDIDNYYHLARVEN